MDVKSHPEFYDGCYASVGSSSGDFSRPFKHYPKTLYPNRRFRKEEGDDFPRLIDADKYIEAMKSAPRRKNFSDLSVPDMIVTVLHNYNGMLLEAFLNPEHENVAFYRWETSLHRDHFFIKKQGSNIKESCIQEFAQEMIFDCRVQCGYINRYTSSTLPFGFHDQVFEYTIQKSGRWKPMSYIRPCRRAWRPCTDHQEISRHGRLLAEMVVMERWWLERREEQIQLVGIDLHNGRVKYQSDQKMMTELFDIGLGLVDPVDRPKIGVKNLGRGIKGYYWYLASKYHVGVIPF